MQETEEKREDVGERLEQVRRKWGGLSKVMTCMVIGGREEELTFCEGNTCGWNTAVQASMVGGFKMPLKGTLKRKLHHMKKVEGCVT